MDDAFVAAMDDLSDAVDRMDRQLAHLRREVRSLIKQMPEPMPIKVRKSSGMDWRIQAIDRAQFDIRRAYTDIWDCLDQKLQETLEEAAMRPRLSGAKGGRAAAAKRTEVMAHAVTLANARRPPAGWRSAPEATDAIYADVDAFARRCGRSFSRRKVEQWLREAGIKRGS